MWAVEVFYVVPVVSFGNRLSESSPRWRYLNGSVPIN